MSGYTQEREYQSKNQIELPDEDPWIRQRFEEELAKRGQASHMPAEAYTDREFKWSGFSGRD
jgi:hypothetical protein